MHSSRGPRDRAYLEVRFDVLLVPRRQRLPSSSSAEEASATLTALRVEILAAPFVQLGVPLVMGIGDGFEEFFVAERSTDVFRRALALASIRRGYAVSGTAAVARSILTVCSQPSPKSYWSVSVFAPASPIAS